MKPFIICHRGALGDFLLTWPALQCLREHLKGHHFLGIGRPEYMGLAKAFGLLDSSLDMEGTGMHRFFSGALIPPAMGAPEGAVLWLSEGSETVRLLSKHASLPVALIPPFPAEHIHVALYHCLAVQKHFPIAFSRPLVPYHPCKAERTDLALIHPGSGSKSKSYSPAFYLRLAKELRHAGFGEIAFLMGPVERATNMDAYFPEDRTIAPADLAELVHVLAGSSLYIGNDSGVSHLAGIIGTPAVTLYRATDPAVWGAIGRNVIHVAAADEKTAMLQIKRHLKRGIVND